MKLTPKYILFFKEISYAFLIAVLFIFLRGYTFNMGDHSDHLVPVYEMLNPGLYEGDFFMDYQAKTFKIRYFYIQLLYFLSFIGPVSFWCFFLTLVCIMTSVYAWMQISFILTQNEIMKFIAPLGIFLIFYSFTLGSNNIIYSQFICSTASKAIVSVGLLVWLRKKYLLAAFALGLATIFHAIAGLQPFIILALILIVRYKENNIKAIITFIIGYLFVSAFVLYPNIKIQFFTNALYDKDLYNRIFYCFRNRHHYLPDGFSISYWIRYGLMFGLFVFILLRENSSEKRNIILTFICIQTFGIVIYTLLTGSHIFIFTSIQWYKSTIWIEAFAAIIIMNYFFKPFNIKQITNVLALFTKPIITVTLGIILLFFITNSVYLPFEKYANYFQVGNYPKSELTIVHEWIKENTPAHSLFVMPPTDTGFGCESLRPAVVNSKAMVHEPAYIIEWYERFRKIYHTGLDNFGPNSFLQTAEEKYERGDFDATLYGAEYGLLSKPIFIKSTVLFETAHYAVVKFR